MFDDHPLPVAGPPDGYAYGLPLVYAVTAVALALAYACCRACRGV